LGGVACALPVGATLGPSSVPFLRDWPVPVGGVLLTASGLYALLGCPVDDIWHRLFGQDVTLMSWGLGRYSRHTGAVRTACPALHPIG
jgi:hypothetical protein